MPVTATLDNTIGACFIGLVASAVLLGVSCLQLYYYFRRYTNDSAWIKFTVAAVWLIDTLILIFNTHAVYHYVISEWGNTAAHTDYVWSMKVYNFLADLLIPMVQTVYAFRIYRLSGGKKMISSIILFAVLGAWAVGLAVGIVTAGFVNIDEIRVVRWTLYSSYSTSALVDILLSACMCYYLQKGKSMFKPTNSMLNRLIFWVLSTGLLTSACSVAIVVLYATVTESLIYLGFSFLLSKLYMNSFLAMLNARKNIRNAGDSSTRGLSTSSGAHQQGGRNPISITVTQDQFREADNIPLRDRPGSGPAPDDVDSKASLGFKESSAYFADDVV